MALAPFTAYDSFSRSVAKAWGTSDTGHAWQGTTSDYDSFSSGDYGRIYVPSGRAASVAWISVGGQASQEVLYKVKWNVDTLTDHGPVIRRVSSNTYYFVRIQDYYHEIAITASVNGALTEMNRKSGVTLDKNTYYWVRCRSDSGGIYVKLWAEGTAEPGSWTLTSALYVGAGAPGAGAFGYRTSGTTSTYTVNVDTMYWWTLEDEERGLPVTDNFNRSVGKGWGWSNSNHGWEGSLADDPDAYATRLGSVNSGGFAEAQLSLLSSARAGFIGPVVNNSEVVAKFTVDLASPNPNVQLGLRGAISHSGGVANITGYYARLAHGSTSFTIQKITTMGGAATQVGTAFTLAAAPAAGEAWWIKLQCNGTTINAKAWKDGTAEPGSFQITATDSSISSGRSFVRVQGVSTATYNFKVANFQHTVITTGNQLNTGTLSTSSVTDTGFNVTATYTNDANNNSTCSIQYREDGVDTWTNATVVTSRSPKQFTASVSGLKQGTLYEIKATYSDGDGVAGVNPLITTVTTALNGLDTGAVLLTADASTIDVAATYGNDANDNSTANVRYRVAPAGAWSSSTAMTPDRVNKRFTKQLTGLLNNTTYEVEVTYADANGLRGTNPLTATAKTLGAGVRFKLPTPITVTPSDVSAIVNVYYDLDTNQNSTVEVQYKSIRDAIWTTVNSGSVTVDRTSKQFRVILSGLSPNLSYQVAATLSDPDGVVLGSDTTRTTVFTTKGYISDPNLRGKHYVFKVYNEDDSYLGTWPDAPTPEFNWHENGGVSDLTVELPRTVSSLNNDVTLGFGHRVDVWAIDGTSDGMGVNLMQDWDMELGSWTLATSWSVDSEGGPDGGKALMFSSASATQRQVLSENMKLDAIVPIVVRAVAKARGGKLQLDIAAYNEANALIDVAPDNAETIGSSWQTLKLEWTPPANTHHIRVRVVNIGAGDMWLDKVEVLQKEVLVYRGRIESYTPKVRQDGESVEVEVLGLSSQLSDIYVHFLQYVEIQPDRDVRERPNQNKLPTDPSNMLKDLVDFSRAENPRCDLYYDADSIKLTGNVQQYTFRDQQLVNAFDKIRGLCPPGWHWFVEPDGRVNLRGPEHVKTHKLRLSVEVIEFENERTIRNLKNYIIVKGRQDSDNSEADKYGSIEHHEFDQESIDRYGKRMLFIRDANITDPATAELVAQGRLEEYNRVEEAGKAYIPDEKDIRFAGGALRGYNIEAFRPGDFVQIKDPISGGQRTYWDQFNWDAAGWDDNDNRVLPSNVPIKTVQYRGAQAVLELSERQPSASGDFAKLSRWLRQQEAGDSN